jgi:hypothetical protein
MMNIIKAFIGSFIEALRFFAQPFKVFYIIPMKVYRKAMTFLKKCVRAIRATPRKVIMGPVVLYRRLAKIRNWIFDKIEYLNAESKKWATVFKVIMSPYSLLLKMGFSPNMALSLLAVGGVASTGAVVNETLLAEKTFENRVAGEYFAPNNVPTQVFTDERYNTLLVTISSTPLDSLILSATSLGTIYGGSLPGSATTAIDIGGTAANRLTIADLTIERLRCKQLKIFETNINTLRVTNNMADGISIGVSAGSGLSNRPRSVIMGNHGAAKLEQSGGTFDRFVVSVANGITDASIGELILSDTLTRGGLCRISYADIGNLTLDSSIFGSGSGIGSKDLVLESTTTSQHTTLSQNLEMAIAEPIVRTN